MVEIEKFYIKLFLSIYTQEKTYLTQPRSFFAGPSLSLLLDIIGTSGPRFFIYRCFFSISKQNQSNKFHKTEQKLLYRTYCHTNVSSHLISLFYYRRKIEKGRQVLVFRKPVVDSEMMKMTILLKQKEIFLFLILCELVVCKKIKTYLNFRLGSMLFPKLLEFCKFTHIKNSVFSTTTKQKCRKL